MRRFLPCWGYCYFTGHGTEGTQVNIEEAFTDEVVVTLATDLDERDDAALGDMITDLVEGYVVDPEEDDKHVLITDTREMVYRAFMAGRAFERETETQMINVSLTSPQAAAMLQLLLDN